MDSADIQYYIGLNELALGRQDLAVEAFKKAVHMDPTLINAQKKLLELQKVSKG